LIYPLFAAHPVEPNGALASIDSLFRINIQIAFTPKEVLRKRVNYAAEPNNPTSLTTMMGICLYNI